MSLSKYTFGEISRKESKSKNLHFDELFSSKSCTVSANKNAEELSFITLKRNAKFKEKLTCSFKREKFGHFSPNR